jgi:methylated-DNA-protein-cysteine methyltransferase related protein
MQSRMARRIDCSTPNTLPDKWTWRSLTGNDQYMTNHELDANHRIWQVVAAIPMGKVTTYGAVAQKAGMSRAARRVGLALRGLPSNTRIPWHRVVNAQGRISLPEGSVPHNTQRDRLRNEGVAFRTNGTIDLHRYGW